MGKPPVLNRDKVTDLSQMGWTCSIERASSELGYSPRVQLEEGLRETIAVQTRGCCEARGAEGRREKGRRVDRASREGARGGSLGRECSPSGNRTRGSIRRQSCDRLPRSHNDIVLVFSYRSPGGGCSAPHTQTLIV